MGKAYSTQLTADFWVFFQTRAAPVTPKITSAWAAPIYLHVLWSYSHLSKCCVYVSRTSKFTTPTSGSATQLKTTNLRRAYYKGYTLIHYRLHKLAVCMHDTFQPPQLTGVVAVGVDILHSRLVTRSFFFFLHELRTSVSWAPLREFII